MDRFRTHPKPPVYSTQPILERTAEEHERVIKRADTVLRMIEDYRAMDGQLTRRKRT